MKSKRDILEDIHTNIQAMIECDSISVDATEELQRIDSDIVKAIETERTNEQIEILSKEVDEG